MDAQDAVRSTNILTELPDGCVMCITSYLTIGQLSNVGRTCHYCHRQFWLVNEYGWKEIGRRFHAVVCFWGGTQENHVRVERSSVVRAFEIMDRIWKFPYQRVCRTYPDLSSLLDFVGREEPGFRVFAYTRQDELRAAFVNVLQQQCCGSGVLHIVRGDSEADLIEAVSVMDASRDTESLAVRGSRKTYCYLAEWPSQTREHDLVLLFTGALRTNPQILLKVPQRLRHRVLIAHRQEVEVSSDNIQALIQSYPRVAVTESFCHVPDYASALRTVGKSREFYLDMARFYSSECGKGSTEVRKLLILSASGGTGGCLRRTFITCSAE